MLWPHAQTRRAIASLRSTMWRLRPVGADPLLEIDPQYIALAPDVAVDWHEASDQIGLLLDHDEPAPLDPQFVAELLPLLRAGELLEGWSEPWATGERQRYRAMRKAARDTLGRGPEKMVANSACGSLRSLHSLHSVRRTRNDSSEP
jgi:hypothetical protein